MTLTLLARVTSYLFPLSEHNILEAKKQTNPKNIFFLYRKVEYLTTICCSETLISGNYPLSSEGVTASACEGSRS